MLDILGPLLVLGVLASGFLFLTGSRRAWSVLIWVLGFAVLVSFAMPVFGQALELHDVGAVVAVLGLVIVGRRPRPGRSPRDREGRPTSAKRRLERD